MVSTALKKQTTREMKEGARQSKVHACAEVAEKREAAKKDMTLTEYRNWKFKEWEKKWAKGRPIQPSIDPDIVYPAQVRRQAQVADALAHRFDDPTSIELKLVELGQLLDRAATLVKGLY